MGVDFIVLCFTIAALTRQSLRSGLWKLLFQDGLVYFCITFMCNAVPAVRTLIFAFNPVHFTDSLRLDTKCSKPEQ